MVDVSKLLESEFVTVQFVKDSRNKKGVILSGGQADTFKDKTGLKVMVEIDGKKKFWKMNKTSLTNFANEYGNESELYIGKRVEFTIGTVNNQEAVIGKPINLMSEAVGKLG